MKKNIKTICVLVFFVFFTVISTNTAAAENGIFDGAGDGTPGNPYIVEDAWDLYAVRYDLDAAYELNNNIDIGSFAGEQMPPEFVHAGTPDFSNWTPIGETYYSRFTGTFDGNGYEISNYTIYRPYQLLNPNGAPEGNGLFGVADGAVIKNLVLNGTSAGSEPNIDISAAVVGTSSGILIGTVSNSEIENITIKNASVYGTDYTAALAGIASNTAIQNITIMNVNVSSTAYNENTQSAETLGYASNHTGILVGSSSKNTIGETRADENDPFSIQIIDSEITGTYNVGMLVGTSANDTITNVEIRRVLLQDTYFEHGGQNSPYYNKQAPSNIGGLAGFASNSNITDSELEKITIDADNGVYVGGLVGQYTFNTAKIDTSDCIKNVSVENLTLTAYHGAGGLVGGLGSGKIEDSHVTGDADSGETLRTIETPVPSIGHSSGGTGGLVGTLTASGSIINSYASIDTYASRDPVGGFVGETNGAVNISEECYAAGNVSAEDQGYVGGFIGHLNQPSGKLEGCYAAGNVTSEKYAGGFIGGTSGGSAFSVEYCYAAGDVSASKVAGGFIQDGISIGRFSNCYATGDVTVKNGGDTTQVGISEAGGFAGVIGNAANCFATGDVTVEGMYHYAGGFAGYIYVNVNQCFASGDVSVPEGYAGGFAGRVMQDMSDVYAVGDVNGKYAGGLAGQVIAGNLSNSYAAGNVTGEYAGGLVGALSSYGVNIYTIENSMALGESVNTVAGDQEELVADKIYGAYAPRIQHLYSINNGQMVYSYDENGKPVFAGGSLAETYDFQNLYAWNGIQNMNGEIVNKINENEVAEDDVTLVKSYNVWDTFGKSDDALRESAWDSSWSTDVWKTNQYMPEKEYMLPILKWQTIERQNPGANAVHLLYLTQIDIETGDKKAEDSTDFIITVDEKEVEYGKTFFSDWEWNLRAAYSDSINGINENIFEVQENMDNSTQTYTTEVKDLSALSGNELYSWGRAELVERVDPTSTVFITERFGERDAFSFDIPSDGGNSGSGSGTGGASVSDESVSTPEEALIPGFAIEDKNPEPAGGLLETGRFSWLLILSLIAVSVAVFVYRRDEENE